MAGARTSRLVVLVVLIALLGLAAATSGLLGSAQAGKTITVGPSGCDFTKIQRAIDAALPGSTIQVQTGIYKENLTIKDRDGLTLQGAGPDKVTLDGNGPQQKDVTPGIWISDSKNITITGFRITNSRRGLWAEDSTLLLIEGNAFEENLRMGICLSRCQAAIKANTVRDTQVDLDGTHGEGVNLMDSRVELNGNSITGNADDGLRSQMYDGPISEATGSDNRIDRNKGGDLSGNAPTTLLAEPPAEGTLDQVAVPADVPTIQEAINKVKAGGTVTVAAGMYKEKVQIYKSVTLRGAGPDQTILQAPGPDWLAVNVATDQLQVTIEGLRVTGGRFGVRVATGPAGSVTLRNVRLDGNGGGKPYDAGLWIFDQVTATLDQVTSSGNQGYGIVVAGKPEVSIQRSAISRNTQRGVSLHDNAAATFLDDTISDNATAGIDLFNRSQATIRNCRVTGTKVDPDDNNGLGIAIEGDARATIQDTSAERNGRIGVFLRDRAQATIRGCRVAENGFCGIVVSHSSGATVDGNAISSNLVEGLLVEDNARAEITNNEIRGTRAKPGFATWGVGVNLLGGEATVRGNTITANEAAGILLQADFRATITDNTIRDNHGCGVSLSSSSVTVTGKGNTISGNWKGQLCGTTSKFPKGFGGGR